MWRWSCGLVALSWRQLLVEKYFTATSYHTRSTKLSTTRFSPALSKRMVSLLPSTAVTLPLPNLRWGAHLITMSSGPCVRAVPAWAAKGPASAGPSVPLQRLGRRYGQSRRFSRPVPSEMPLRSSRGDRRPSGASSSGFSSLSPCDESCGVLGYAARGLNVIRPPVFDLPRRGRTVISTS